MATHARTEFALTPAHMLRLALVALLARRGKVKLETDQLRLEVNHGAPGDAQAGAVTVGEPNEETLNHHADPAPETGPAAGDMYVAGGAAPLEGSPGDLYTHVSPTADNGNAGG